MMMGNWDLSNSPGYIAYDMMTRVLSPYQIKPANMNPLLELLEETVDFELVRKCDLIKIFISDTTVETGRVRPCR